MSKRDPHLTEKVIGFRYWVPENGWLGTQGLQGHFWGRGVNEAQCRARDHNALGAGFFSFTWATTAASIIEGPPSKKPHIAPENGCTCGLHAYHEPLPGLNGKGPFTGEAMHVLGAVKAWGRMEVHRNGFRSQYAEIIALAYNEFWPKGFVDTVQLIARSYEVDCVPMDRLQSFALEQGSPVPDSMRPGFEFEPKYATANPVKQQFLAYHQQFSAQAWKKGQK